MSDGPFAPKGKIVEYAEAGGDKFNELLVAQSFARQVRLRSQGDRWYVWNGKAWAPRTRDSYRSIALNTLPRNNRYARHAKSVMDHAEMAGQIGPDEHLQGAIAFDEDGSVLINVDNGVLRVTARDVTLCKHDEKRMFTGSLPAAWDENAEAPTFMRVVNEALPPEVTEDDSLIFQDLALLQWFAGYLLFPDCKQHEVFLICYGPGGTGKSTVSEAIVGVVGGEPLLTSLSMGQICAGEKAYSLPELEHALVNLGTELDTVEVSDSANFKKLVSGEVIEARTIYGRPFPMRTSAKLWFNANDLPRFKHGTDAELRRARFLCFDQKPGKEDRSLKAALASERNGVLRWMVQGLQYILAGLPCPEGGQKSVSVKGQFAVSNDPVRAFFEERLQRDTEGWELKSEVADAFKQFMDHRGFPQKATEQLFRALYQRFPFIEPRRKKSGNDVHQVLCGVTLRDDAAR